MNDWAGPEQHITKEQRNFMYHSFTGNIEGLKQSFDQHHASAYVNVSQDDKTALYWAAVNLHPQAVEILLKHGADPFMRPPKGVSAGLTVLQSVHKEVWEKRIQPKLDKQEATVESLKAAGDQYLVPYLEVVEMLNEAEYQRILPLVNKARISPEKFFSESTRLQRQGERKIVEGVHFWADKKTGRILPASVPEGMTPLHVAVARMNDPLVRELLAKYSDISERNRLGLRPLEMAIILARREKMAEPIAKYLQSVEDYRSLGRVQVQEVRTTRLEEPARDKPAMTRRLGKEEPPANSRPQGGKPVGF